MAKKDKPSGKAGKTREEIAIENEAKSEKELQWQVFNLVKHKGVKAVCVPRLDKRSTTNAGWPDGTFCYKGLPCVWEVKMPNGKLSEEQERMGHDLHKDGWSYKVIRSAKEALEELERLEKEATRRQLQVFT